MSLGLRRQTRDVHGPRPTQILESASKVTPVVSLSSGQNREIHPVLHGIIYNFFSEIGFERVKALVSQEKYTSTATPWFFSLLVICSQNISKAI